MPAMDPPDIRRFIDEPAMRADVGVQNVTNAFLKRIELHQGVLSPFITVTAELARKDARRLDGLSRAKRGPLHGVAIAVKDNIDVEGVATTVGSAIHRNSVATRDAAVVRRLRDAGAVVVGKASMHEFAFGHTCASPTFGTCNNAWDTNRIPGGSSSGSGVAVAADLCVGALGTDTGGSVRVPAALNGVVGFRPTFGRVSNRGVFPLARTFDTTGPMARTVRDVAALLAVMEGYDPDDPRSVSEPRQSITGVKSVRGMRIGVPRGAYFDDVDEEVAASFQDACVALHHLGAAVVDVSVTGAEAARDAYSILLRAEAASVVGRYSEKQLSLVDEEIRRRIVMGLSVSGTEVIDLYEKMLVWQRSMGEIFQARCDVLVLPTTPSVAPLRTDPADPTFSRLGKFTHVFSFGRLPGITIPAKPSREGLPIGVQLTGPPFSDHLLLLVGQEFQRLTSWHLRRPTLLPS